MPRLSDTVMALMFEELERAASDRGYFAMVATSGDDPRTNAAPPKPCWTATSTG
ncbi:transcriptional regulator protein [Arthrobacter sp. Hiyo8]|nr:transcriptional regulator protein [Arthrobacter sp. Hiyo8]